MKHHFSASHEPPEEDAVSARERALLRSQFKDLVETGSVTTFNGEHMIYCLTIIGQIEGHYTLSPDNKSTKYEHVIPQLVAIEESAGIDGLLILLNTVGGDIEAGLALAELIAGMKKPTVSLVLGGGHSIGVPLAVAAKKSFIPYGSMGWCSVCRRRFRIFAKCRSVSHALLRTIRGCLFNALTSCAWRRTNS